jgi:hypothetical protein
MTAKTARAAFNDDLYVGLRHSEAADGAGQRCLQYWTNIAVIQGVGATGGEPSSSRRMRKRWPAVVNNSPAVERQIERSRGSDLARLARAHRRSYSKGLSLASGPTAVTSASNTAMQPMKIAIVWA